MVTTMESDKSNVVARPRGDIRRVADMMVTIYYLAPKVLLIKITKLFLSKSHVVYCYTSTLC